MIYTSNGFEKCVIWVITKDRIKKIIIGNILKKL